MLMKLGLGLPPRHDSGAGRDPAFQGEPVHFFDDDQPTRPWYGVVTWPAAFYSADAKTTYIAWQAAVGSGWVVRAMSFTRPRTWRGVNQVGHFHLPGDDHGNPAICRDADGYLYAFFGAHNNDLQWAISDAPDDISAWTRQPALSASIGITYPKPSLVGSTIYLFYRRTNNIAGTDRAPILALREATPSAGAATFGAEKEIVDFGADSRIYAGETIVRGTGIHFCATRSDADDTVRKGVYYFIYDTIDGSVRNVDGSASVAAGSLPVGLTQANADFRVVDHGANRGDVPSLAFDSLGNAHVLYLDGAGASFALDHIWWNGAAWSVATSLATIADKVTGNGVVDVVALVPGKSGQIEAWYPVDNSDPAWAVRGGDMVRRVRQANGTWDQPETIVAADARALAHPSQIRDGHADLRAAFTEISQSPVEASRDFMKRYMHGDKGFIIEPAGMVIEGEAFADVTLQLDASDRGTGPDAAFASVVLLLDNSIGA